MQQQIRNFLTPSTPNERNRKQNIFGENVSTYSRKSSDNKRSLSRNRKPIFDKNAHYLVGRMVSKGFKSSTYSFHEPQQKMNRTQNITYDFCGCQSQMSPCSIIERSFLKNALVRQMKGQYQNLDKPVNVTNLRFKEIRKTLFQLLPVSYPEIFHAHLNNLLVVLGVTEVSENQFLCLSWIHYHCKIQYLTFFLYSDLSKSLQDKQKYFKALQVTLINKGTSIEAIQIELKDNKSILNKFLNVYFQSVGAILIPITQYAKILQMIANKGTKILIKLIVLFMAKKKDKFFKILKFMHFGQIGVLRNYVRQLNWQSFRQEILNQQP